MKKLFFLVLLLSNFFGYAQYTLIPDANFEQALFNEGIDRGNIDGKVLKANISGIKSLEIRYTNISDLTGIEDFTNLETIVCNNNNLKSLDLSKNTFLSYLNCDDNRLTDLNISKNVNLKTLRCNTNQLKELDVLNNFKLIDLECGVNLLTNLDVSKNINLDILWCTSNQLTNLNISNNINLTMLVCYENQLTSLDVSKNISLTNLMCTNNLLTSLNLKNKNNRKLDSDYLSLTGNPNLICIQVDDKAYSDSKWSKKDATASYSENCSKTAATIAPPVITASGNQTYCPGTSLKIVEDVYITFDSADPEVYSVYIQISSGYINGQDQLILNNASSHPSITAILFDTNTGILKLTSATGNKVSAADYEAAIKDVQFNSSLLASGSRDFSISIGTTRLLSYLPRNKHFYEYIPITGITWTDAKAAAESKSYFGLTGYLATLTAADEAQLAGEQAPGTGWIGGSDAATEGVWRWVTGPEGLANGGTGVIFWNGVANGSTPNFAFWNTNEPNQYQGANEDYAHITAPGVGIKGSWNDMTNLGDNSGATVNGVVAAYQAKGYVVEYGGMVPGDVDNIKISASTTITIPKITSTTPSTICGSGVVSLQSTASENSTVYWFDNPTTGKLVNIGNSFITPNLTSTTSYFVDVSTVACLNRPRIEVPVIVNPLPIVKDVEIIQCDTDLIVDGKTLFNLTVNNTQISSNSPNETFSYYTSVNGANNAVTADLIPNELAFENTTPTQMDIWSRIANKITGCYSVSKITLKVPATNIPPTYKIPFDPVCDDFLDSNGNNNANNDKRDGITTFDFSATKAIILAQLPKNQVYAISYYKNESDALAELNVIADISNYRNIGYPNSQDIWIRIDSDVDNACYGLGPYLTLNVEALPVANAATIPRQCDDDTDGVFTFNTSTLESDLLKGQNNVTVTYFDQTNNPLKDANGVPISSPFPINFKSSSQTIKAVVTNTTPQLCFDETTITFIVDDSPEAFPVASNLTSTCDDELDPIDQDGKFAFDTSTFETAILGGQKGMIVKYYDQNNVLLPSPLPNPFITNTQNITVNVQNSLNTICSATTTLNFVVNPVPNIDLNVDGLSDELVCSNLSTFFVTLNAGIIDGSPTSNYDFVWKKDEVVVGANSPILDVNAEGIYTVEVTNNFGCSRVRTITVTASNSATIVSVDVVDLTDVNTVTVNVTGPGDYQYSLDEPTGFWQDSNFFNNVPAGIHVVYVNDKNGCGTVNQEIILVGIPKYFTPNGDSFNDVWEIKGLAKYPQAQVQVFDRYGKYLITLNGINKSWNGTFNGFPLPSDDYWYVLNLGNGKSDIKGHFSLKR